MMLTSTYNSLAQKSVRIITRKFAFAAHLKNEIAADAVSDTWNSCVKYKKDINRDERFVAAVLNTAIIRNVSKHMAAGNTYYKFYVKRFIKSHSSFDNNEIAKIYNLPVSKIKKYRKEIDNELRYAYSVQQSYSFEIDDVELSDEEKILMFHITNDETVNSVNVKLGWSRTKIELIARSILKKYGS